MSARFVTGTGTEIGKTHVAEATIRDWRGEGRVVRALKPVVSGFDAAAPQKTDTGRLLAALGTPLTPETIDACSPWRYAAPLSPDMAAAREGRRIPYAEIVTFCRDQIDDAARHGADLLIEGIGGVMVPLDDRHTVLDLIAALELPAVLVGGSYLGALSHALTAFGALRARGVSVERIVVSETPASPVPLGETCETLARFADPVPVEALAYGG